MEETRQHAAVAMTTMAVFTTAAVTKEVLYWRSGAVEQGISMTAAFCLVLDVCTR